VKHPASGQDRVTMSLPWINASRRVVFLVTGQGKSAALDAIARGGSDLPAALVQPSSGHLRWLAERL
jgi:6-phosphogluconolactonase